MGDESADCIEGWSTPAHLQPPKTQPFFSSVFFLFCGWSGTFSELFENRSPVDHHKKLWCIVVNYGTVTQNQLSAHERLGQWHSMLAKGKPRCLL